jgi:hypothetical protein
MNEIDSRNQRRVLIRQILRLLLALLGILLIIALVISRFVSEFGLGRDFSTKDIDDWQISSLNSLHTEVLWQKNIPCLREGSTSPYDPLTVSSRHVVVYQSCTAFDDRRLLTFDRLTGSVAWTSSVNQEINSAYQISHTDTSYFALIDDSSIARLDYEGNIIWRSEDFDSRTVRSFEFVDGFIYAPYRASYGLGFYVLSEESGQTIERL